MKDQLIEQAILDALNQHNSYLQRLSSTSVNEILKSFDALSIQALNKLRDLLDDLNEAEKTSLTSAKYSTSSLKEIQGVLAGWQQSISTVLPEILDISMIALASYESAYIYKLAGKKVPKIIAGTNGFDGSTKDFDTSVNDLVKFMKAKQDIELQYSSGEIQRKTEHEKKLADIQSYFTGEALAKFEQKENERFANENRLAELQFDLQVIYPLLTRMRLTVNKLMLKAMSIIFFDD